MGDVVNVGDDLGKLIVDLTFTNTKLVELEFFGSLQRAPGISMACFVRVFIPFSANAVS